MNDLCCSDDANQVNFAIDDASGAVLRLTNV
jgi:hypothetical protein